MTTTTTLTKAMRNVRAPSLPAGRRRATYLTLLTWAFTLFSSLRAVSYLPTL